MEGDDHGEAYTAIVRGGTLSRERHNTQRPRLLTVAEGNMSGTVMARCSRSAVVADPITHEGNTSEPGRSRDWPAASAVLVRAGKAMSFSRR